MKREDLETRLDAATQRARGATSASHEMAALIEAISAASIAIVDELKDMNRNLHQLRLED